LPSTKKSTQQLRLRIFAGPNGSGKSTIIKAVKETVVNGNPIDFGYYINADDITQELKKGKFSFGKFHLKINEKDFEEFTLNSGLVNGKFTRETFNKSYELKGNSIYLSLPDSADYIGQIIARYLREELLRLKKRFSFETVFSHDSNLDIMRRATEAGYKVYLYFVSTESAEINKYRVEVRVKNKGHYVPADKIVDRYNRSLGFMYEAAQLVYQAFFFDNSNDNEPFKLVAHFKKQGNKKIWDKINKKEVTSWFKKFYSAKVERKKEKTGKEKS
jgi:predicted ABC-type ATPase